jgi:hypothetical protein
MEPDYHQIEFEVRMYLTHLDVSGTRLWGIAPITPPDTNL